MPLPHWDAQLTLGYSFIGNKTTLVQRQHHGPLVVQKPFYPEGPTVCHTIPLFPPGGIAAGDRLEINLSLASDSQVLITTPAAGKCYKSSGAQSSQQLIAKLAANSFLEWLPQENIIFDGANTELSTHIELDSTAGFIGWDISCLGRTAAHERFTQGRLRQMTAIWLDGKLLWHEQSVLYGSDGLLQSPVGLAGRTVAATLIAIGKSCDKELLKRCRELTVQEALGDRCGITCMPNIFIARYLGHSAQRAKFYFENLWSLIRPFYTGRIACPPRIWKT